MASRTRDKIIDMADNLFYQQGFENTSFADIANKVGISRGNFYHHFKSKDSILDAVIKRRLANTEKMLTDWHESENSAEARIKCFINILLMNRAKIKLYGCPVGSLTTELGKLSHPLLSDANKVFTLFKRWLTTQFKALGNDDVNAEDLAMQVLARSQGAAIVASAFHDESFLYKEVEAFSLWLDDVN